MDYADEPRLWNVVRLRPASLTTWPLALRRARVAARSGGDLSEAAALDLGNQL
jgi:hypothetical protein